MKRSVSKFNIHQTSKVIALMYAFMIAVVLAVMFIFQIAMGMVELSSILAMLLLGALGVIAYGILFYVTCAIGLFVYNFIAKRAGGIEFFMDE